MKKLDSTTWILLLILLLWLLNKKSSASTLRGARGATGAAGAAGKQSILQQFFGKKPAPGKAGASGSAGASGTSARPAPPSTAPPNQTGWRPPTRKPVNLLPSAPLTSLIPSLPPPVYNLPERNYYDDYMATIPSDTSGIYVTPDQPPSHDEPLLGSGTNYANVYDQSGNFLYQSNQLQYETPPTYDSPEMTYQNPESGYRVGSDAGMDLLGSGSSYSNIYDQSGNYLGQTNQLEYEDAPTYNYPTMNYSGNGFPGYDTGGAWGSGTSEPGTFKQTFGYDYEDSE